MKPDHRLERAAGGFVAGVDEAGRGPLAGPVVAGAAILDAAAAAALIERGIDDSKRLSRLRRAEFFAFIADNARLGIGAASAAEIDTHNILQATMLAMRRAVAALGVVPDFVLVDGNRLPDLPCPARAVIGGDRRSVSIAAAAIVAKVTRDRIMGALARRYPDFGWERNAGYGTAEHRSALARVGVTVHHRRSFAPVAARLAQQDIESHRDSIHRYSP